MSGRSILSRLCLYFAGVSWLLAASIFAFYAVFNENSIKDAFNENNVYEQIVPIALEKAKYSKDTPNAAQLPLQEPWVADAVKKTFPASDLATKGETVIDSVFTWLEGKTQTPKFELDFSKNKEALAQEAGNYTQNRLAGLPYCTLATLPERPINLSTLSCIPPGFDSQIAGQTLAQEIAADQSLLTNTKVTSDDLSSRGSGEDILSRLEGLRKIYQLKPVLMILTPLLAALLAIGGVMVSTDRRKAFRSLLRLSILAGIGLGILTLMLNIDLRNLSTPGDEKLSTLVVLPVSRSLADEAQQVYLIFTLISFTVGIGLFLSLRKLQKNI